MGPGVVPKNDANAFVAPDAEEDMVGGVALESGLPNVDEGLEEKKLEDEVVEPNPLKPPSLGKAGTCEESASHKMMIWMNSIPQARPR